MTGLSVVVLSACIVSAICALLALVVLRALGKAVRNVSDAQEERSRVLRTITLRHELLECEVRATAWQVLYLFTPDSSKYDHSGYVMERLEEALGDYRQSGKKLRELEEGWASGSDCLMERTNAFRLVRSIIRRAPSGPSVLPAAPASAKTDGE